MKYQLELVAARSWLSQALERRHDRRAMIGRGGNLALYAKRGAPFEAPTSRSCSADEIIHPDDPPLTNIRLVMHGAGRPVSVTT